MSSEAFFTRFNRGDWVYMPYGRGDKYGVKLALFYEEALWCNYMLDNWTFDKSKLSTYERKDYQTAVEKLRKWNEVYLFRREVKDFIGQIRRIVGMRRFVHSRLHLAEMGYPTFEFEILEKYRKLLDDLKDYPEWKAKVEGEVENHVKLLFDEVGFLQVSDSPFRDFDLYKYFK
jgi:hypothetical protein